MSSSLMSWSTIPRISAASVPGRMGTHSSEVEAAELHTGSIEINLTSDLRWEISWVAFIVS